jgi:predicted ATP-grasp superfamily ATP-dependent carboligase
LPKRRSHARAPHGEATSSPALPADAPPALVFGEGITSLAVVRALGRANIPLLVAARRPEFVQRSRWCRPAPGEAPVETADGERIVAYLRGLPLDGAVTFPTSDDWAIGLASLPPGVGDAFRPTTAPPGVLRTLIDKGPFATAAERSGVPIPRTIPVARPDDLDGLSDEELPGFFLKPRDSGRFNARYHRKGLPVRDRVRAAADVERLTAEGYALVLQEYIPGPMTDHVFLDGYVDRSGHRRACLARRRLRMYPPRLGNSTLSVTIDLEDVRPALADLSRLFDDLGFRGFFDAEFKYDARDGRFKLLEVNARPWWQFELAGACGLDIAGLAYRDALGLALTDAPAYPIGRTWVNPGPDLLAWRALRCRGPFPARVFFAGANAVWSADDPFPAFDELLRLSGRIVRRRRAP